MAFQPITPAQLAAALASATGKREGERKRIEEKREGGFGEGEGWGLGKKEGFEMLRKNGKESKKEMEREQE